MHTCVVLESRAARCWGDGVTGAVGYGTQAIIGDDESPADMGDLELGGPVVDVAASYAHMCAVLEGGTVRCWGGVVPPVPDAWDQATSALLGQGDFTYVIGDDEFPADYPPVEILK